MKLIAIKSLRGLDENGKPYLVAPGSTHDFPAKEANYLIASGACIKPKRNVKKVTQDA